MQSMTTGKRNTKPLEWGERYAVKERAWQADNSEEYQYLDERG